MRALTTSLLVGGILLLVAVPVFVVGRLRDEPKMIRSFAIGAVLVGLLCGMVAAGSERQVAQCLGAGNSDCVDSGAAGLQAVMIGLYVVAAWSTAWLTYRQ